MAVKRRADYTDLLVQRGIVSADQLEEARELAAQSGMKLPDALSSAWDTPAARRL